MRRVCGERKRCTGAVMVLLIGAMPARADRAGVEFTLSRMQQAVLAGDGPAYLMNVVSDDAVLRREQENWARDLALHTPSAFELAIHDPAAADNEAENGEVAGALPPMFDAESGLARFEMVMAWTLPKGGRDGGELAREVSFPVVFKRGDDGRWLYAGEDWKQEHSSAEHRDTARAAAGVSDAPNTVYYFDGFADVARRAVNMLPEVRAHVDSMFELRVEHPQVIKIYPTMRHLQSSIYLSYVDGLSGWNEPGESIKLLASDKTGDNQLRPLLAHEYGHVATFELGPHATTMPWWALEGVADQSAEKFVAENGEYADKPEEYGRDAARAVERWAKRDRLAPWDRISVFRDTPREFGGHVYKQGQHMLGYITRRFGLPARNAWLTHLSRNTGPSVLDDATREALGLAGGFEELNAAWRATLPPAEPPEPPDAEVIEPKPEAVEPAKSEPAPKPV